ncbi:GRRM system radical SAM/SPASM domain protein [Saccharothrix violaceirubra]
MSIEVAQAVADSIRAWTASATVEVCWHGGEPLATGRTYLSKLMDCFNGMDVKHSIQTNATLINESWCRFLAGRQVHVGVSIDGDNSDNVNRVDRSGRPAYGKIVRGIREPVDHGHEVHAIAVVSDPSAERARRLYEFAASLGISELGVNIEEQEGVNATVNAHDRAEVIGFWSELTRIWAENPVLRIREVARSLGCIGAVLRDDSTVIRTGPAIDPLPTVGYDGSVTLIPPELAGFSGPHGSFATGSILVDSLDKIIARSEGSRWIAEFARGVENCRASCAFFDFCGGGHPANRYFELGRLDTTETNYCRNSKIALLEGVLKNAQPDAAGRTHPLA